MQVLLLFTGAEMMCVTLQEEAANAKLQVQLSSASHTQHIMLKTHHIGQERVNCVKAEAAEVMEALAPCHASTQWAARQLQVQTRVRENRA